MQYTIEARQLNSSDFSPRPSAGRDQREVVVEAGDAGEAISEFVRSTHSELVEVQPCRGRETIATVKNGDSVFLVRVYAN